MRLAGRTEIGLDTEVDLDLAVLEPHAAAPGEGEIELFTNGMYVEVEQQGALAAIPPGGGVTWTVRWKLRRVPGGTTVAPGNADLVSFATTTLAE